MTVGGALLWNKKTVSDTVLRRSRFQIIADVGLLCCYFLCCVDVCLLGVMRSDPNGQVLHIHSVLT